MDQPQGPLGMRWARESAVDGRRDAALRGGGRRAIPGGGAQKPEGERRHGEGVVGRRVDVNLLRGARSRAADRERRARTGAEQDRRGTGARAGARETPRERPFKRRGERGLQRRPAARPRS